MFAFKVVKNCKSSLERQVREAIRIQMRGTVLNKKGMYNRCKLTRLVIDDEWEQKVWKDAWTPRVTMVDEECVGESLKTKRKEGGRGGKKKQKLEAENGVVWGEEASTEYLERSSFLYTTQAETASNLKNQGKIITYSGIEWLCRQILRGVADTAIELSDYMAGVEQWGEWEEEIIEEENNKRKEERRLWRILEESDREQAKELERKAKKAARKVNQA